MKIKNNSQNIINESSDKENPCYHCYTGAIGECAMTHCKHQFEPWSKDVESMYLIIHKEE